MTKAIRFIQNYLVWAVPFVIVCMVWSSLRAQAAADPPLVHFLWEALSWNLIVWFATLLLFLVTMSIFPAVREGTLIRLANIRERDEREQLITGKAARAAFLSTLSLLVLLFFLSIFTVDVTQIPKEHAPAGKNRTLSIGVNFGFFDRAPVPPESPGEVLFNYGKFPVSKAGLILIVIFWQLVAFHVVAKRET